MLGDKTTGNRVDDFGKYCFTFLILSEGKRCFLFFFFDFFLLVILFLLLLPLETAMTVIYASGVLLWKLNLWRNPLSRDCQINAASSIQGFFLPFIFFLWGFQFQIIS